MRTHEASVGLDRRWELRLTNVHDEGALLRFTWRGVHLFEHEATQLGFDRCRGFGCLVAEGHCDFVVPFTGDADREEVRRLRGGRFVSVSPLRCVEVGGGDSREIKVLCG